MNPHPRYLGSLFPYSGQASTVSRFGMAVAQNQLIRQLLDHAVVDGVNVFATSLLPRIFENEREECELAVAESFRSAARRPAFKPLSHLPAAVREQLHCFLSPGTESHRLAQVRASLPEHPYPILTIVHAVNWMDALANYAGLVLSLTSYDVIVATSCAAEQALHAILDWIEEATEMRCRARIVRIPLGIDSKSVVRCDRQVARGFLGIPDTADLVLYVGRLSDEYKADLTSLLRAATLRRLATELGLATCVQIVEDPADTTRNLLYAASDVFVSPSDNIQESFGVALLEAMAYALPVVASDWSGYRDIVRNGESGFLIPTTWDPVAAGATSVLAPLDTTYGVPSLLARHTSVDVDALEARLVELIAAPDLRRRLGQCGRHITEQVFDWEVVANAYRDLFDEQLSRMKAEPAVATQPLDLNRVFAHYASQTVSEATRVACTSLGHDLQRELETREDRPETASVLRLLRETSQHGEAFGRDPTDHQRRERLVSLMKDGFVRASG